MITLPFRKSTRVKPLRHLRGSKARKQGFVRRIWGGGICRMRAGIRPGRYARRIHGPENLARRGFIGKTGRAGNCFAPGFLRQDP
ncbi:MAG: hypothetical protein BJ554DRAFT_250, partial [Olpidium bornovanus]